MCGMRCEGGSSDSCLQNGHSIDPPMRSGLYNSQRLFFKTAGSGQGQVDRDPGVDQGSTLGQVHHSPIAVLI